MHLLRDASREMVAMHPVHGGFPNSCSMSHSAYSAESNCKFILLLCVLPQSIVDYSGMTIKPVTESLSVGLKKKKKKTKKNKQTKKPNSLLSTK